MSEQFTAAAQGPLFTVLSSQLPGWGKNTLRERVRAGCIEVDGVVVARTDHPVMAGAKVVVKDRSGASVAPTRARGTASLPVLFLDDDLMAVDKPDGLLSVSTDDETERTALSLARSLLPPGKADLWPCHRLDRETSGVLLFARTKAARDAVQGAWGHSRKVYAAVVDGQPEGNAGTVEQPLWEDRNLRVRVGEHAEAKEARTRWTMIARGRQRCWLEVELDTGRKHQIRAHFAWLGHPVVGDDRYGTRARRLCLHAQRLEFPHPRTGETVVLEAPVPAVMRAEFDGVLR